MNASSASTLTSTSSDADAPASKKARLDEAENSQSSPQDGGGAVDARNFAQDGPRNGTLTLSIDDWNTFINSTEKVYSEPLILSGVQFTAEASISAQNLAIRLAAAHPTGRPEWHCKTEFAVYRPRGARKDIKARVASWVFDNASTLNGWSVFASLDRATRVYVRDNNLTLKMDVTTFNCQVTDGIYGHKLRGHDVAFIFGDRRIYSNKGGMFFGDFADRNKDELELPTVDEDDFETFLQAISAAAPPLRHHKVLTILRMADRLQAHKLTESCVDYLLTGKNVPPFVAQMEIADELSMTQFRDRLIETATNEELTEAAKPENEEKFSAQTWMKLFLKYRELRPPV